MIALLDALADRADPRRGLVDGRLHRPVAGPRRARAGRGARPDLDPHRRPRLRRRCARRLAAADRPLRHAARAGDAAPLAALPARLARPKPTSASASWSRRPGAALPEPVLFMQEEAIVAWHGRPSVLPPPIRGIPTVIVHGGSDTVVPPAQRRGARRASIPAPGCESCRLRPRADGARSRRRSPRRSSRLPAGLAAAIRSWRPLGGSSPPSRP